MQHEPSDEELARRSLDDPSQFASLVGRYEAALARFILRLFPFFSKEDVGDILQESLLNAYRNLNEFDQHLKFSAWIYRIVRNQAITTVRARRRNPVSVEKEACCDELYQKLIDEVTAEHRFHRAEVGKTLEAIVNGLPKKERDPFILRFLEDMDYSQISDVLKIPIGTVSTLIRRGRERFVKDAARRGLSVELAEDVK